MQDLYLVPFITPFLYGIEALFGYLLFSFFYKVSKHVDDEKQRVDKAYRASN